MCFFLVGIYSVKMRDELNVEIMNKDGAKFKVVKPYPDISMKSYGENFAHSITLLYYRF